MRPRLVSSFLLLPALTLIASTCIAQTPGDAPPNTITLTTGTQLVVVDVTVLDRDGHPVHGLKLSDFVVDENKKPAAIRNFEEHTAVSTLSAAPKPPRMTPGTFTDYEAVPLDNTLNVLLLDALNTPMTDQAYVRNQLQQYVKHAAPGTRIAIFGLNQTLTLLQSFSADPELLKSAIEHKLLPRASTQLDDPTGGNSDSIVLSDELTQQGMSAQEIADVQQFEAQNASFQTQTRIQYTLDAFNALARYLAQFPGRKNLIWFSGSFPLAIFPDPTIENPFSVEASSATTLRDTTNLLSRARVAVYPVDARGLQNNPAFDSSRSGKSTMGKTTRIDAEINKFAETTGQENLAMEQIAQDTGGRAFYNTNDLATAVSKSITAGANYYTIAYSPSNHKWDSTYRGIHIRLEGPSAARGLKLSYRTGYFADDPNHRSNSPVAADTAQPSASSPAGVTNLSMQRGAPALSEILFKVRVLPASTSTEDSVAPGNILDAKTPAKGPFRRYMIDFAAMGGDFHLPVQPDGRRHGSVEFITYVYDSSGKLLNANASTVQINLDLAAYKNLLKTGLGFHQEISVPAHKDSFLRLGIRDLTSSHMGVVEVSTSTIERLPPAPKVAATESPK